MEFSDNSSEIFWQYWIYPYTFIVNKLSLSYAALNAASDILHTKKHPEHVSPLTKYD